MFTKSMVQLEYFTLSLFVAQCLTMNIRSGNCSSLPLFLLSPQCPPLFKKECNKCLQVPLLYCTISFIASLISYHTQRVLHAMTDTSLTGVESWSTAHALNHPQTGDRSGSGVKNGITKESHRTLLVSHPMMRSICA